MVWLRGLGCAALLFLALAAAPAKADTPALDALVADYEAWALSDDPFEAGRRGDAGALSLSLFPIHEPTRPY